MTFSSDVTHANITSYTHTHNCSENYFLSKRTKVTSTPRCPRISILYSLCYNRYNDTENVIMNSGVNYSRHTYMHFSDTVRLHSCAKYSSG